MWISCAHHKCQLKKNFFCILSIHMQKNKFVPHILHGLTWRRACCFNLPDLSLQCAWFKHVTFLKADGQNLSLCQFFSMKLGFGWWVLELTISIGTGNGSIVSLVIKERCQCLKWMWKPLSCAQLFATPSGVARCSGSRSSVQGILKTRILEWVPFSRRSSQPRNRAQVSYIAGGFFTVWATRAAQEYWSG